MRQLLSSLQCNVVGWKPHIQNFWFLHPEWTSSSHNYCSGATENVRRCQYLLKTQECFVISYLSQSPNLCYKLLRTKHSPFCRIKPDKALISHALWNLKSDAPEQNWLSNKPRKFDKFGKKVEICWYNTYIHNCRRLYRYRRQYVAQEMKGN